MTQYLLLLLMGPWMLILAWAYWCFPRSVARVWLRRVFDVTALLLTACVAVVFARWGYDNLGGVGTGDMDARRVLTWRQIVPVVYAYAGFSLVLIPAAIVRQLVWRRRG